VMEGETANHGLANWQWLLWPLAAGKWVGPVRFCLAKMNEAGHNSPN
jgi:hypothetical protein